jgi:transposase
LPLYLYGSLTRRRSRRRLEQATHRNVAVRWLLKKRRREHKTIADFRTHNRKPLRQVCRTLTLLCKKLALFGAALGAIDGRPFRAVHAQERTCTQDQRKKLSAQLDERVEA